MIKHPRITLLVCMSLGLASLLAIRPSILGCGYVNQSLLLAGILASPFVVWLYDLLKVMDYNRQYSFLTGKYKRTSIKELRNGQYVDVEAGLNESIQLKQKGRTFEGEIQYHSELVEVTLELDSDNKFIGKGIYRYSNKTDFGFYEFLVDNRTKDKIFLKYKNKRSSNPSESEKVEGIEIWERDK